MSRVLHAIQLLSSWLMSGLRLGMGAWTRGNQRSGVKPLELFDFEACPHCRLVREAVTELALDVRVFPCPKGGERFRPVLTERAGKAQFPYLVDPNTGEEMYESGDIVRYLFRTYGRGVPIRWWVVPLQRVGSVLASLPRPGRGMHVYASSAPAQPLRLTSRESHGGARLIRERLCELELSYDLHSAGRPAGAGAHDREHVPTLHDPNTGSRLVDVQEILRYLADTYAV